MTASFSSSPRSPKQLTALRGLSICHQLRSHTRMDPEELEKVIRQALVDAQAADKNHRIQTELAVEAILEARPDMTVSKALTAVNMVLRQCRILQA